MSRTIRNDRGEECEVDEHGYLVDGVLIKIELLDVLGHDIDGFWDRVAEDAGFSRLTCHSCEVEGHEGNDLLLRIRGDVSDCLESDE